MRVVIDTNVLVSAALLRDSVPRKALTNVMRFCTPICSAELLAEYRSAMMRPALDRYTTKDKRIALLAALENGSDIVRITGEVCRCRDPRDDLVLETAIVGKADVLVTGDGDLLSLKPISGLAIVTPREYVEKYV